jgi:hypothetical protein
MAPLVALEGSLGMLWAPQLDLARAEARLRSRRPAFDAIDVIGMPDDLSLPFLRATKAIERAGLASNPDATAARAHAGDVLPMIASWLSGDLSPRNGGRATARRAAIIIGRIRLRAAARAVRDVLSLEAWAGRRCPCCGGHPEFAIPGTAQRSLICSRCDSCWTLARSGCTGCGAHSAPTVARVSMPDDAGYCLVVCNACGLYLKEGSEPLGQPILVERALTAHLDRAAEARGLRL